MADVVDPPTRSRMMAGIRGANTKPEIGLRRALHRHGFRFRLHDTRLPGRPDIVLPRYRAVIFVHGCFWHRHQGCHWCTTPTSRSDFWNAKFRSNVERDKRHLRSLQESGWRVATVWECALRREGQADTVRELTDWLSSTEPTYESKLVRTRP